MTTSKRRVLLFGTFDPLHDGHRDLFRQARELGDELVVVVAHDEAVSLLKGRPPSQPQSVRQSAVAQESLVDEVLIGDADPRDYALLRQLSFDVLALGYDQQPSDEDVASLLSRLDKEGVTVARLKPYKEDQFKSSYFR